MNKHINKFLEMSLEILLGLKQSLGILAGAFQKASIFSLFSISFINACYFAFLGNIKLSIMIFVMMYFSFFYLVELNENKSQ